MLCPARWECRRGGGGRGRREAWNPAKLKGEGEEGKGERGRGGGERGGGGRKEGRGKKRWEGV